MSTNLSGTALTLNNTILNEETMRATNSYYYIPNNCKAGDTVILDGIECLCVATGVTIQGSNLTRIAVDKNYDLGYYQRYVSVTQNSIVTNQIDEWRWGGYGISLDNNSKEIGYGLQNTINCLARTEVYTKGTYKGTLGDGYPWLWQGVNDFRSSHSNKWFLPSLNELLNYVYPYKSSLTFDTNTGGSSNGIYWSSSDYSSSSSYYVSLGDGSTGAEYRYYASYVRLCRAF